MVYPQNGNFNRDTLWEVPTFWQAPFEGLMNISETGYWLQAANEQPQSRMIILIRWLYCRGKESTAIGFRWSTSPFITGYWGKATIFQRWIALFISSDRLNSHMGVSLNGGSSSHHPFQADLPRKHHPLLDTPIVGNPYGRKDSEVPPPPGLPPNFASLLLLGHENWGDHWQHQNANCEVGINSHTGIHSRYTHTHTHVYTSKDNHKCKHMSINMNINMNIHLKITINVNIDIDLRKSKV